jgi:alpha-galactosidase
LGVLGLCYQSASLSDEDVDAIAYEIALYKSLRPTLALGTAALLSPQANTRDGPSWDVLQVKTPAGSAVVYAFDNDDGADDIVVSPLGLEPDAVYRVLSVDSGTLGDMTGADLMAVGIRIVRSPRTAAHVLLLTPEP